MLPSQMSSARSNTKQNRSAAPSGGSRTATGSCGAMSPSPTSPTTASTSLWTPTRTTPSAASSSASLGDCPGAGTRSSTTATRSASSQCGRTGSRPSASGSGGRPPPPRSCGYTPEVYTVDAIEHARTAVAAADPLAEVATLDGYLTDPGFAVVRRALYAAATLVLLLIGA